MSRLRPFSRRDSAGERRRLRAHIFPVLSAIILFSSLDLRGEEKLERALDRLVTGRSGSALVTDPATGEVLAAWNPRAAFVQAYPPGSTAKLVESVALLEERKVTGEDRILCRRVPELLGEAYHCSHPFVGFPFDLKYALAYSCNYFFSAMSVRLPPSDLGHWYGVFGFGSPVAGWGARGSAGRVRIPADPRGKARAALGEGTVLVTPAQLLLAYSAVATGGRVARLHPPNPRRRRGSSPLRMLRFRAETIKTLQEALELCVREGTCQGAAVPGVRVAGKTGTATALDGRGTTHAWFVGYAPADAPEVALVVFLERGTGSRDAAPLAGEILKNYFASKGRKP